MQNRIITFFLRFIKTLFTTFATLLQKVKIALRWQSGLAVQLSESSFLGALK